MKKLPLLLVLSAGCAAEEGTMIEILGAPTATSNCSVSAQAIEFRSGGLYDPTGSDDYTMTLLLQNNLKSAENDPATFNGGDLRQEANGVTITGFDTCYYLNSAEGVSSFDPNRKGVPVDCEDLPESQRQFVLSSLSIESAGGRAAGFTTIFGRSIQRALFGEDWAPEDLVLGSRPVDTNGDLDTNDSNDFIIDFGIQPPDDASRHPGWGTFPTTNSTTVVAQLRAVGRTQTGKTVRSNWYTFPIDVCVGCVLGACGPLYGDGSCTVAGAVKGKRLPANACLPYSGHALNATCNAYEDCPD